MGAVDSDGKAGVRLLVGLLVGPLVGLSAGSLVGHFEGVNL